MPRILRLHEPVASRGEHTADEVRAGATSLDFALERLRLAPGRALGADEFDRMQRWQRARVDVLLAGRAQGIVDGLEVEARRTADDTAFEPELTLQPGVAIGADGLVVALPVALTVRWDDLVAASLLGDPAPAGATRFLAHLIVERQLVRTLPGTIPEAARREELDATLDRRLDVFVRARLRPLSATTAQFAALAGVLDAAPARLANLVTAALLGQPLLPPSEPGVVVALVGLDADRVPRWIDVHGARRLAHPHGPVAALAAQCDAAFSELLDDLPAPAGQSEAQRAVELAAACPLDYLPAAGTLPPELLVDPAGAPHCPLFGPGHDVDLVPIGSSQVAPLLRRELPRPPLERASTVRDRIRLLIEVADRDWRPDLLDLPAVDLVALDDLFDRWRLANDAHAAWRSAFLAERFAAGDGTLPATRTLAGGGFTANLTLATTELAPLGVVGLPAPQRPEDFLGGIVAAEVASRSVTLAELATLPRPYRDALPLAYLSSGAWLSAHSRTAAATPADPAASEHGRVVRRLFLAKYLDALDQKITEQQSLLDQTRDLLLGQRHQLDAHTMNFAALSGGTATDGSGLSLTRKLPYSVLEAATAKVVTESLPASVSPVGSTTSAATAAPLAEIATRSLAIEAAPRAFAIEATSKSALLRTSETVFEKRIDLKTGSEKLAGTTDFGVVRSIAPEIYALSDSDNALTQLATMASRVELDLPLSVVDALKQKPTLAVSEKELTADARFNHLILQGSFLISTTAKVEQIRVDRERQLRDLLVERSQRRAELAVLDAEIAQAEGALAQLAAALAETQDDYALAQRVVAEDWERVEATDEARTKALRFARGLHYVRARAVRAELAPADPLPLRFARADDLLPGIAASPLPLPDELDPFLDLLRELPVTEYASTAPLAKQASRGARWLDLDRVRVGRVKTLADDAEQRVARVALRVGATRGVQLRREAVSLWRGLATRFVLRPEPQPPSLRDAVAGPAGALQSAAARLSGELERAAGCLLATLAAIAAGPRLRFAQDADDDRLPLETPLRWPLLGQVEATSLNHARSLVELVDWWFARLDAAAGAPARSAMRNALRALLLLAAHGDPSDLVRGTVDTPPPRLDLGALVRVRLSRDALPGTLLHLHDEAQVLRGVLAVEERDDDGVAVAKVVRSVGAAVAVTSRFTVSGRVGGTN